MPPSTPSPSPSTPQRSSIPSTPSTLVSPRYPAPDLSSLPTVFILAAKLASDRRDALAKWLVEHRAPVTYDVHKARIVLANVERFARARLELRGLGLWTEKAEAEGEVSGVVKSVGGVKEERGTSPRKRMRVGEGAVRSGKAGREGKRRRVNEDLENDLEAASPRPPASTVTAGSDGETTASDNSISPKPPPNIKVIKLHWLNQVMATSALLPYTPYLIYEARPVSRPSTPTPAIPSTTPSTPIPSSPAPQPGLAILQRAREDALPVKTSTFAPHGSRRFHTFHPTKHTPKLPARVTTEYEGEDTDIPPAPAWVRDKLLFSCQRRTPPNPPNAEFIAQLGKIKHARLLTDDEIGVRAYSTCIAAIAAYEYPLRHPAEILRLPGCDTKIANLWIEWRNTGRVAEADAADSDPDLQIVNTFYNIWGVGATTARDFFYRRGWRDLDDIVEEGWSSLPRVQQIGLKYYDEFLDGIPRAEVEAIAETIRAAAVRVRDPGIEILVVGGYRRGKEYSGDVDVIVSHRELAMTHNLVVDVVGALEDEGWVTHTLLLSLAASERGQATLPFKARVPGGRRTGFDTLDKALLVWQDSVWEGMEEGGKKAKNPNPHRRVDIIVSPWRTVGCAVLGWSGGTTFQRDIRRYANKVRGWKFDSSGIRDRRTGEVVALEGERGVRGGIGDAERAVFEGLGLFYREPWERCTG
ncbi:Nucleotidyltransferase [Trichodelitschia bisporula]|uniref:DNA polymerase n=1 Tax=Trichodelitschia bisporula TaxID=703511 RepID=A0A6G1HY94_9PEZI|nr:Nucleotidyltransferase [Trichodelitschia bisporula]